VKKNILLLVMMLLINLFLLKQNAYCFVLVDSNHDSIGYPTFELYRMEVNQSGAYISFDIFTNYPGAVTVGDWQTFAADLAIDVDGNGSYEYGVAFTEHDGLTRGSLYRVTDWHISNDYYPNPTIYSYNYNRDQIVTIEDINGSQINSGSVNWYGLGGSYPYYRVNTNLYAGDFLPSGFNGNINVFYGGATCANDYIKGSVPVSSSTPEPATLSLLGLGLLGLIFRRKKV
jgi:hypothetical protein